jgi:GTP-binding protein
MFFDEAKIFVSSGRGGDGIVHFRREKYVPRGGPDGGDGGKGGDVILEVDGKLNTLSPFRRSSHFKAEDGRRGGGSNQTGRNGEDVVVSVPPGTLVRDDANGDLLGDLVEQGEQLTVAQGGRGGRGNARYATSRNQTPRMAEKGAPKEERWLLLELRLIADVGIIGVPNVGKSTLLSVVTNAKPKIADYPFTTLQPNLGVARMDGIDLVLADIPGLIEGAHSGAGLGFDFLRHIQRTKVLIHLIDGLSADPIADYSQINAELALFDENLSKKPQVLALSKMDLPQVEERWPKLVEAFSALGCPEVHPISSVNKRGLRELLFSAQRTVENVETQPESDEELPVYRAEPDSTQFEITHLGSGDWRVRGGAIERAAAMTYWEYDEAVRRFQHLLERLGIEAALREAGASEGDTIHIGEYELEWRE